MFLFRNLNAQQEIKITWDYRNSTFIEFVTKSESLLGLKFYYKDEWVSDLKITNYHGISYLSELLDSLFRGTSLYYYIDEDQNVAITKNFLVKSTETQNLSNKNIIPNLSNSDNETNQELSGNVSYEIGNPADKGKQGDVILTGYVTNKETKEPVPGVTVYIMKQLIGAETNKFGYYSLRLPRGNHLIQYSFIGMKEIKIIATLFSSGELNVEMNNMLIPLEETIISAQKKMIFHSFEVGVEKINISSFKLMPTSIGEADIFKSILSIPGVQSVGEGSTGFNVRGGAADQNLILLYGSPIYNASHFFGFFSAVNSEIIKDVTLYKGGIPGRYGGRISSVLDIESKDGNKKKISGNAGISPITTNLMIEGPIIKDTCTFIFSGRTTYSDWLFKIIDDPNLKKSSASFYDINGKITYDLNRKNKLDLSAYLSNDSFKFNTDTIYGYKNSILALRWRHFFNNNLFSVLSINNSNYQYDISSQSNYLDAFVLTHSINSTGFKGDFNWFQGRNEINFGYDFTRYSVKPGSYLPTNDSSIVTPRIIDREKSLEAALYFDYKLTLNDYISINTGLRVSSYFTSGPKSVLLYDPSYPYSNYTVTDTLDFKRNELCKYYLGPELRLSLIFKTSISSSLKINYNRTRQYLHLLSNSTSISPSDTWKLCDYYLKPQIGDQYAIGFYQMLLKDIETSVEVYFKKIKNVVDYKGGTRIFMIENIEQDLINSKAKAYGLEFMIRKTTGRVRWLMAYTYSRTFLKSVSEFNSELINSGNWFPANYDKPNDLIISFNYLFSRRLSFTSNYTWSTGRPITYPLSTYSIDNLFLFQYSERNKYRIPDYSRLDISIKYNGNLKLHRIGHPNLTFSVYNLLGRQNAYSVYFVKENDKINGYKLSVFARAIPSLTFCFDF